jgi:hypothetical protein
MQNGGIEKPKWESLVPVKYIARLESPSKGAEYIF